MQIKRWIIAVGIAVLVTGCNALGGTQTPGGGGLTPPTLVPDLGKPEGVALTFLDQWMKGDTAAMYSLLSPKSQAEYTQEVFTNTYQGASDAMTLIDLKAEPISVFAEATGTTAQFAF